MLITAWDTLRVIDVGFQREYVPLLKVLLYKEEVMRRFTAGILLILGIAAATAWADDFWVKKSWKEWTKGDCNKMLTDSPWAKRVMTENASTVGSMASASHDPMSTAGPAVLGAGEIDYRIQLRSAEPIRQALIRQEQIDKNYDKMSDDDKKAFDAKMNLQMGKLQGDFIIFHVIYEGNSAALKTALAQYWQGWPNDGIPPEIFLVTESGTRVPPSKYVAAHAPDMEFDLFFPRSANNQLVIAPGSKSVKLQIKNPRIGDYNGKVVNAEFKLEKMMLNVKAEF